MIERLHEVVMVVELKWFRAVAVALEPIADVAVVAVHADCTNSETGA
jgi:hypothetical protein